MPGPAVFMLNSLRAQLLGLRAVVMGEGGGQMDGRPIGTDGEVRAIVDRYAKMIFRLAYARTRNRMDAEDICQEVILKLVSRNPAFADEEHRKAWLIRAALNLSANLWRSARRRVDVALAGDIPSEGATFSALDEALSMLPGKDRAVLHLFYYVGMTAEEIGRALRRRPSTVRAQLTRARRKVKDIMEGGSADV